MGKRFGSCPFTSSPSARSRPAGGWLALFLDPRLNAPLDKLANGLGLRERFTRGDRFNRLDQLLEATATRSGSFPVAGRPRRFFGCTLIEVAIK